MNFRYKFRNKYGELGDKILEFYDDGVEEDFNTNFVMIKFTASKRAVVVPKYRHLSNTLANYIILNLVHNEKKEFKWIKK